MYTCRIAYMCICAGKISRKSLGVQGNTNEWRERKKRTENNKNMLMFDDGFYGFSSHSPLNGRIHGCLMIVSDYRFVFPFIDDKFKIYGPFIVWDYRQKRKKKKTTTKNETTQIRNSINFFVCSESYVLRWKNENWFVCRQKGNNSPWIPMMGQKSRGNKNINKKLKRIEKWCVCV